jgi:hypothetical protein
MSEVENGAPVDQEETAKAPPTEPAKVETGENQPQPAEKAEGSKDDDASEKRRSGLSKRFSELTQARREAEARAERAEREAATLREQAQAKAKEGGESEPRLDQFDDYEDYVRAVSRWEARQAAVAAQSEALEARQKAAAEDRKARITAEYQAKADIAREKFSDFDAVAYRQDVPVSQTMVEAIMESELGAELQYFWGQNPEEAARIAVLSPQAALLAIGRLEARIASQPAPSKATKAPDPISPVAARATAPKSLDEMTDEEYAAFRREQKRNAKRF